MRTLVHFDLDEVMPPESEMLHAQGLPPASVLPAPVRAALDAAREEFRGLAAPVGIVEDLPGEDFLALYPGEGCNPPDSPLPGIVRRAEALALYAATVGEPTDLRIGELFAAHEVALGYLLDTVASAAGDRLSRLLAARFGDRLVGEGRPPEAAKVLPYSPGYCGWHVSGQRRLFARLHPEGVGIRLNDTFLMTPLKSVSGVLVAGSAEAHRFRADYPFCEACATHECARRLASARGRQGRREEVAWNR
jgi:hypothetical protein